MGCRVAGEVYLRVARVRPASSASTLVEQNDPIDTGVKVLPPACGAAGTRSTMEDERGLAGGIAARYSIQFYTVYRYPQFYTVYRY